MNSSSRELALKADAGTPERAPSPLSDSRASQIISQANAGDLVGKLYVDEVGKVFLRKDAVVRSVQHAVAWADLEVWSERMHQMVRPALLTALAEGSADQHEQLEAALTIRKLLSSASESRDANRAPGPSQT